MAGKKATFDDAFRNFLTAAMEPAGAWQRRIQEAQFEYMKAIHLASTHPDGASRAAKARREYLAAERQAAKDSGYPQAIEEAFRGYVQAMQAAWAAVNLDKVDAKTLATIGTQTLAVHSWLVAHSRKDPKTGAA